MASTGRFLVVDDHPLFSEALQRTIAAVVADAETIEAKSIDEAKRVLVDNSQFAAVLLDLSMPGTHGFEGLLELRTLYPKLPIIVVSALEDPRIIREAMGYGAAGFIAKSSTRTELAQALGDVLAGYVTLPAQYRGLTQVRPAHSSSLVQRLQTLTPKQLAVLKMLRQGLLNKQIAHELQIEETTVKAHVSEILRKLNVASRTQAVIEAQKIDFDVVTESAKAAS